MTRPERGDDRHVLRGQGVSDEGFRLHYQTDPMFHRLADVYELALAASEGARLAAEAQVAQLRQVALRDGHVITEQGRQLAAARAKIAAAETVATHFDVDTGTGPLAVTGQDVARRIFAALAAASGQCPTCGAEVWEVDGPDVTAEGVPSQCANGHQFYAPHTLAAASGVAPDKPAPKDETTCGHGCGGCWQDRHEGHDVGMRHGDDGRLVSATCHDCDSVWPCVSPDRPNGADK